MGQSFNALRRTGTTVPRIQEMYYELNPLQTFGRQALVVLDTNGFVIECPSPTMVIGTGQNSTVTSVTGVAMNGVGTKPGYNVANDNLVNVRTGAETRVSVVLADREQEFSGRLVDFTNSVDPVVPTQALIGQQYGAVKYNGDWVINYNDQTNVILEVTDYFIPSQTNTAVTPLFVAFKFLPGVVTVP